MNNENAFAYAEKFKGGNFQDITMDFLVSNDEWFTYFCKNIIEGLKINFSSNVLKTVIETNKILIKRLDDEAKKIETKQQEDNNETLENINRSKTGLVNLFSPLVLLCSNHLEECKEIVDELVKYDNEDVRVFCCTSLYNRGYDFSKDKAERIRVLYNFMKNYYSCKLREFYYPNRKFINELILELDIKQFRFYDGKDSYFYGEFPQKKEERFNVWVGYESYNTDCWMLIDESHSFCLEFIYDCANIYIDSVQFQLLMDLNNAIYSRTDYKSKSNCIDLYVYRFAILYNLIVNNLIEFERFEPPFVKKIRQYEKERKLKRMLQKQ